MMKNEIVDEVRKHRTEVLQSYDGDIEKMVRALMEKQGSRGHTVVTLTKKVSQPGIAPNAYPLRGEA
jgi:ATP-dependent Zn protease